MINASVAVDHTSKAGSLGDSGEDPQQRESGVGYSSVPSMH